jgi:signal transduction histidine kinase
MGGTMRISDFGHASGGSQRGHGPQAARGDTTHQPDLTGASRGDVLRDRTTARVAPPTWRRRTTYSWLDRPAELVVLTASVPLLIGGMLAAGVPRETGFQVIAGWSLAQVVLVLLFLEMHHHARDLRWQPDDDASPQAPVGDVVEIGAQREQDRLHEVRTTMAGIGMTHRLLRDGRDRISGADRARLEQMYDREISRLERLLRDDVRAGDENVDVHSAVDPVVDSLRLRGQQISWEGTQALAVGSGDDVAEIVHILLHNAMRHAPGSEVSMEVESTPTEVRLRVSDDGPGVPSAMAPVLFERGIRRPDSPGEGIGLQIARRLAREMGGDLRLDPSSTGRGAAFILTLRACAEAAPCLTLRG